MSYFKWINNKTALCISRVEVNNVIHAETWNVIENCFDQISMWIDNCHAFAIADIIDRHVGDKCGLPSTTFPNNIHVATSIFTLNAKRDAFTFKVRTAKEVDF